MLTKGPNSKAIKRILSTHRTGYRSALDLGTPWWWSLQLNIVTNCIIMIIIIIIIIILRCINEMHFISFHTQFFIFSFFFLWKKWMLKEIFEQQRKLTPPSPPLFLSLSLWCALPNSRCTLLIHFSNFHISQITNGPARSSQRQC